MKVLHLTGWPIPENLAGTEVFVTSLCRQLQQHRVDSEIGCLDVERAGTRTEYQGITIHRFEPVHRHPGRQAGHFVEWLNAIDPDVIHVQSLTEGLAGPEVEAADAAGYPVVFTAHVPGVVCYRGTMMRHGRTPCDGRMVVGRCSSCFLQGRGLPAWAGRLLNAVPEKMRCALATMAPSPLATGLRLTATLREHFAGMRSLFDRCQRVIAVCQWLHDALRANGVPESKLVLSRQATDLPESLRRRPPRQAGEPLRVGYLGRYDPIKGVDVLVKAVAGLPHECNVRLVLHGSADGCGGPAYRAKLQALAARDRRISIGGTCPRENLAAFFAGIDLLAVPSTWLETGPLVVYEALAHRTPVLGSRLGGIAELVRDGIDGWLIPAGNVAAWRRKLEGLAAPESRLPPMDLPPPALRSWDQVAKEMAAVYRAVVPAPQSKPECFM